MRSGKSHENDDNEPSHSGRKFELFFFETAGGRTHLRFTRLAVLLIFGLTVASIVAILMIFLISSQQMVSEPINVNVSVPTRTVAPSDKPILKPPPPAPRLPTASQPVYSMPTPSNTPVPNKNSNRQIIPRQTPQSPTSESPP